MNGAELARAVKADWPDTAVVLLTGFGGLMNAAGELPSGVDVVLSKPAGEADLKRALAAAASGRSGSRQPQAIVAGAPRPPALARR